MSQLMVQSIVSQKNNRNMASIHIGEKAIRTNDLTEKNLMKNEKCIRALQ